MIATSITSFWDERFSATECVIPTVLPFFHSCDAIVARSILLEKKLLPSPCTVFQNEKLLYFFYGRPAYKKATPDSSGLNSFLPVSFILKSSALGALKRVAPFDTGAFARGYFERHLHPAMEMNQFLMTPAKQAIPKTVAYFFENNECYFKGEPKVNVMFDSMDFELESYYQIINDKICFLKWRPTI